MRSTATTWLISSSLCTACIACGPPPASTAAVESSGESFEFDEPIVDDAPHNAMQADPNIYRMGGVITDTRNRGRRERHEEPGWEFKQILEVYSMHAFRTGWDHSTSVTITQRRPVGSNGEWTEYRRTETCNHGTCPHGSKDMHLRYICDPGVVIDGWYAEDGECSGDWGPYGWNHSHLCNDDLALQINNAFGRWSGDFCAHKGRMITPPCKQQW